MNCAKLSIVIPVYNVEKYLRQCIDSLLCQSLRELEIILVNDASPDASQAIIEEYAAKDSRIIALKHPENAGMDEACITGVERASAEYLMILDSDDTLLPDACQVLYEAIVQHDADIVQAYYNEIAADDGRVLNVVYPDSAEPVQVFDNLQAFSAYFAGQIAGRTWGKIYKTNLWKGQSAVRPPWQKRRAFSVDSYIILELLALCQKYVIIDKIIVNYRQHQASIMNRSKHSSLSQETVHCGMQLLWAWKTFFAQHREYAMYVERMHHQIVQWQKQRFFYQIRAKGLEPRAISWWLEAADTFGLRQEAEEALASAWTEVMRALGDKRIRLALPQPRMRRFMVACKRLSKGLGIYPLLAPLLAPLEKRLKAMYKKPKI